MFTAEEARKLSEAHEDLRILEILGHIKNQAKNGWKFMNYKISENEEVLTTLKELGYEISEGPLGHTKISWE